jgi:hypothetical protein
LPYFAADMNDTHRCSLLLLSGTGGAFRFKRAAISCGIDELRGNVKKFIFYSMNRFGLKNTYGMSSRNLKFLTYTTDIEQVGLYQYIVESKR